MMLHVLRTLVVGACGAVSCSLFAVEPVVVSPAGAAPAAAPASVAPAPASPVTILADLRGDSASVYPYGSWTERINRTANGVVVVGSKGAQGDGGTTLPEVTFFRNLHGQRLLDSRYLEVEHNNVAQALGDFHFGRN